MFFLDRLNQWRALSRDEQHRRLVSGDVDFTPSDEPDCGRVRVGIWCPCLGLGGAEVWQLGLAGAVDRSRIAWKGAAVLEGRAASDPRMVEALGAIMPVGHGWNAAKALAAVSDVILTWAVTDVDSLLQGLEDPPGVVMACHFPAESPWGPGTENLLRSVDRFVAVSELAVESTPPSVRGRVEVIWNAIDPARLQVHRDRSLIRAAWNVPIEAKVVGFIGRLSPEKDPDAMLRLASKLEEPWHVVIVGEGRERACLEHNIETNGLSRVHLVGGDPAAGDVLNGFDALMVPSHYESFGLTLAEGLRAGLPVVATRSGLARLVPDLVREIPVKADGLELREALMLDMQDAEATRTRVDHARAFVEKRLGLDRFGREWTELLVGAARTKRAGGSS
jgi:glycosyltransferase involved in cell wall biosynthesis